MTIEKSHPPSNLGCLCAILGCLVGVFLGFRYDAAVIAAMRAKDPTVTIDFLPVMPFFGFVSGGFLGALIGKIVELFIPQRTSHQHPKPK